jgi:hypothetical protein
MAKSKKSGRETAVRDVTGVPTPAGGGSPNAGVVKRIVKGGGKTSGLSGGADKRSKEALSR